MSTTSTAASYSTDEEEPAQRLRQSSQIAHTTSLVSFEGNEIIKIFQQSMLSLEGQILAAYYLYTSQKITDVWCQRTFIEEFKKADRAGDITALLKLDTFKKKPTNDILIVDKLTIKNAYSRLQLERLIKSGIQLLVRTKLVAMLQHYKQCI